MQWQQENFHENISELTFNEPVKHFFYNIVTLSVGTIT